MLLPSNQEQSRIEEQQGTLSRTKAAAFCSYEKNTINIVDLETTEIHAEFQGATSEEGEETYVKEIPDTQLLCSLQQNCWISAQFKIFHVANRKQHQLFSTEEVKGVMGFGFIAHNQKRDLIGTITIGKKTSYHLVAINPTSPEDSIKLIRKARWHSQFADTPTNSVADLDFNAEGHRVAMTDRGGIILIADADTNSYLAHLNLDRDQGSANRCRWLSNESSSLLYINYNQNVFNIYDVEKNSLELKSPYNLDLDTMNWFDVCPVNSNLLASVGSDKKVKIYDRRVAEVVKTLDPMHSSWIRSVRWSIDGEQLITSSDDKTVKVLDYSTSQIVHTFQTSDGNNASSACFF